MSQQPLELEVEERKVTRLVQVELSVADHAQLHKDSCSKKAEIHDLETAFKVKQEEHKAALRGLEAELDSIIDKQSESREEECIQKTFFENNLVQVWHGDKLIEERALTAEERQMHLGPIQHGTVVGAEEDTAEVTPEEFNEDLSETMREERKATKMSLVDLR